MKTGANEGEIADSVRHESSRGDDSTEDEGIVSDESPPSSASNDEILIKHQDLKDLDLDKDVLQVDKRRTNVGQRTKNKEKTKPKREKVKKVFFMVFCNT